MNKNEHEQKIIRTRKRQDRNDGSATRLSDTSFTKIYNRTKCIRLYFCRLGILSSIHS